MKRWLLSTLLALCMVLVSLPNVALAVGEDGIIASGECGDRGSNVTWTLDSRGTLTLSGIGSTQSYNNSDSRAPWYDWVSEITEIVIGEGITCLAYGTLFCGESPGPSFQRLDRISLSSTVTKIDLIENTGAYNFRLAEFNVDENNPVFSSVNGVLFSKDMTTLVCYPVKKVDSCYNIPDGVTYINDHAFTYAEHLSAVTFPTSIKSIGNSAFSLCFQLADVDLPDGLTHIGMWAFGNTMLENITIPASVTLIEPAPFHQCSNLKNITVDDRNTTYCSKDGVLFNKGKTHLVEYPDGRTETEYIVPDGVEQIDQNAFGGCKNLTSINLPDSLRIIASSAFGGCSQLQNLIIPDGTTNLAVWSFMACSALTEVVIPSSVRYIQVGAFTDCTNLRDIYYQGSRQGWIALVASPEQDGGSMCSPNETFEGISKDAAIHFAYYDVLFDANGGGGIMSDMAIEKGGEFVLPSCGFAAPTGKEFKAWLIDGVEYAPGDTYTATADTTITAVWQDATTTPVQPVDPPEPVTRYTLSGTITGHQGITYTSVSAKLVRADGQEYAAEMGARIPDQQTGKTAYPYTVSVPAGTYTLEVAAQTDEGGTVNRTASVTLTSDNQTVNINLPNGQAKVKDNTQKVVAVKGLSDLIDINDNPDAPPVEVTLTVESVNPSAAETAEIQAVATGQALEFVELSITKSVNGTETSITDTGNATIEIVLPFESRGKSSIKVYRCHDNGVETLTEEASPTGEKIEISNNSITIYAKKFSVYAIGYVADAGSQQPTTPSTPSSGSNGGGSSSGGGNYSNPSYSITAPSQITGGTVKVNPTSAEKGTTVTITATPKEGYELDKLTVADSKGNELTLTSKGSDKYTFTMPATKVTVSASFAAITPTNPIPQISFADVQAGAYYYDAVAWAAGQGITAGTSATTFSPDNPCTRAQIVTFLWRAAGSPVIGGNNPFTDVASGSYYYDAVAWAVANGITGGTSATTFSPDDTCTRGQAVTFLYRAAGSPAANGGNAFTDVASGEYYASAVQWAVNKGVTAGTSATTFSPNDSCTRAQIVTFLYRDRVN